jgi:hypothetical protein
LDSDKVYLRGPEGEIRLNFGSLIARREDRSPR